MARYRLKRDDVVCVRTGDPGRHALVGAAHTGMVFGTACLMLRAEDRQLAEPYLRCYLGHVAVQDWIERNCTGSAIRGITEATIKRLPVVLPPPAEQRRMVEVLAALDDQVEVHTRISRVAGRLRDAALSTMLCGESD